MNAKLPTDNVYKWGRDKRFFFFFFLHPNSIIDSLIFVYIVDDINKLFIDMVERRTLRPSLI